MVEELFFTRNKNGWRCSDRSGRWVEGATKSIAKRVWYQTYEIDREPKNYGFDLKTLEIKI